MTIIYASGTINISANFKTVFEYISNLENDKYWRKEIKATTMASKPQVGTVATEHSFLSKSVPDNILVLKCLEFVENSHVLYQTLAGSEFYLKSLRKVDAVAENKSKLTYTIEFDMSIVKHGLGFGLPKFVITLVTKIDLKKYLKKLKTVIEEDPHKQI